LQKLFEKGQQLNKEQRETLSLSHKMVPVISWSWNLLVFCNAFSCAARSACANLSPVGFKLTSYSLLQLHLLCRTYETHGLTTINQIIIALHTQDVSALKELMHCHFNHRSSSSCATLKEQTDEGLITMNAAVQCSLCPKKNQRHDEENNKC
jgi:hypothetical protein